MEFKAVKGATPLDEEQKKGLIPDLKTQTELNEFEARNITDALLWAKKSRKFKKDILSVSGIVELHKRMLGKTWKWAGSFRTTQTNIGVAPRDIQNQLGILFGDVLYWLENKTYNLEEIAIRLHHRLVYIHPFPNGNGRHARLIADLFLEFNGEKRFSWGAQSLIEEGAARETYINALRRADAEEDYVPLLAFARGD